MKTAFPAPLSFAESPDSAQAKSGSAPMARFASLRPLWPENQDKSTGKEPRGKEGISKAPAIFSKLEKMETAGESVPPGQKYFLPR